jgi:hypothetical protein
MFVFQEFAHIISLKIKNPSHSIYLKIFIFIFNCIQEVGKFIRVFTNKIFMIFMDDSNSRRHIMLVLLCKLLKEFIEFGLSIEIDYSKSDIFVRTEKWSFLNKNLVKFMIIYLFNISSNIQIVLFLEISNILQSCLQIFSC